MEKIIYVTGITGFIGRNLLKTLSKKYNKIINLARDRKVQVYKNGDISEHKISQDLLLQNPSDTLINLATLYKPYPSNYKDLQSIIEANILFPSMVLEELSLFSTLKIVNALSYHQLLDLHSQNIYSLSKELFKRYLNQQGKSVINIYIFDTFGSGDIRGKVTDTFIRNVLAGKAINIPKNDIFINLSECDAITNSIMGSLELDPGDYMIKSPDTISLESLAHSIMKILDKEVEIVKTSTTINFFDLLTEFPKNIFLPPNNYNFNDSLIKRVNEIKNGA
jgi:nucleoside-diphosphate-sugar epimerase